MYCQMYVSGKANNMFAYTYKYMVRFMYFYHYLEHEVTGRHLNKDGIEYSF